jgi:hypothetical protein
LLTSLVAFGVTVVAIRLFLELADYPQVGNNVLHIAHALWGALLLVVAVILPLVFANRWSVRTAALLSGVGIGLFIDEVGKFITQKNDYFFPPALPLIYGSLLLMVFGYYNLRRAGPPNPREAIYNALDRLKVILDGDLDDEDLRRIEAWLITAGRSENEPTRRLAESLTLYLQQERHNVVDARPGIGDRVVDRVRRLGRRFGRRNHRRLISLLLVGWVLGALILGAALIYSVAGGADPLDRDARELLNPSSQLLVDSAFWLTYAALLQALLAAMAVIATGAWLRHREVRGKKVAMLGLTLSLVLMQPLLFYINQLSALAGTLQQFFFLLVLLAYDRWYLQ